MGGGNCRKRYASKILIVASMCSIGVSQVPLSEFFPYSSSEGASGIGFSDDSSHHVSFVAPFKFLNHSYWVAYIGSNGVLSFRDAYSGNGPQCITPGDIPKIMVYLADAVPASGSSLTYFETTRDSWLRKATQILRVGFPYLENLNPSWLFVVTWKDVAGHGLDSRYRNTFQAILTFDSLSSHSYVIFLYNKIEWVRGNYASVGFDAGNSQFIYTVNGSCTSAVSEIAQQTNIKSPGKWAFKVDTNIATELSCGDTSSGEIDIQEKVVSVMGNLPLVIKICLDPNATVTCEFKDPSRITPARTKGILLPSLNEMVCPVPFLYSLGRMALDIIVSSGSKPRTLHQGHIFVVTESDYGGQPTILINKTLDNSYLLTASWDPASMRMEEFKRFEKDDCSHKNNFTFVEVTLLEFDGYKWTELGSITKPAINTGVYVTTFNTTRFQELTKGSNKILIRSFGLKAKHVLPSSGQEILKILPANIASGMNALLPHIQPAIQANNSNGNPNIFDRACQSWYSQETLPSARDTLPCPLSVKQAMFDWRFQLDDFAFSSLLLNSNVSSIYIQRVPTTSGGATQCLFDKEGRLIIEAGKRVLRRSPTSWKNYWLHYWNEPLPYLFCSKLGNLINEYKSLYLEKRLVNDDVEYKFPKFARAVGQGHMTTFDGLSYEIAMTGEYVVIAQASSEEFSQSNSHFKMHMVFGSTAFLRSIATVIDLVAIQQSFDGHDINVQVHCPSNSKLSVMVNEDLIDVEFTIANPNLFYPGLTILLKSRTEVILAFATGFAFNIRAEVASTSISVLASMDPKWNNKISGLWGNSDGESSNDFMDPEGLSVISVDDNPSISEIHESFASLWLVNSKNSLLPRIREFSGYLSTIAFTMPSSWFYTYNYTSEALLNRTEHEFCGGDLDCEFDFEMASTIEYAEVTKAANTIFHEMKEIASLQIKRCPWISKQPNLNIIVDNYYLNSTLQLQCSDDREISPGVKVINFTCILKDERAHWVNPTFGEFKTSKKFSCITSELEVKVPKLADEVPASEKIEDEKLSPKEAVPVKVVAAEHSDENHSSSGVVIFIIVIIIILVVAVVAIMKYPPCRPLKLRILGWRMRSESAYNFSENASVSEF